MFKRLVNTNQQINVCRSPKFLYGFCLHSSTGAEVELTTDLSGSETTLFKISFQPNETYIFHNPNGINFRDGIRLKTTGIVEGSLWLDNNRNPIANKKAVVLLSTLAGDIIVTKQDQEIVVE